MNFIWKIDYFSFLHGVTSCRTMTQLSLDLPRSQIFINDVRMSSVDSLLGALDKNIFQKAIIPFLTQASCALLVIKLNRLFDKDIVRDGGEPLQFNIKTDESSFSIDIDKSLIVMSESLQTLHVLECVIHIHSDMLDVLICIQELI